MEEKILQAILENANKNIPVALVTLTCSQGSTPRDHGSIMAVFSDGSILGSIGGGKIEYAVINEAKQALKSGENRAFSHMLTPEGDLHMQCGGSAKGYIKIFGVKNKLIIAGGGHVGEKLLHLGKFLGFYTILIDDREDFKHKESLKISDEIIISPYQNAHKFLQIDQNTYIIVATKSHDDDLEFVKTIIKSDYKYLGLIGSQRKHKSIRQNLQDLGFSLKDISKIYGPVGLKIANQLPEEIALSILAEILLVKNKGKAKHMCEEKNETNLSC